MSTSSNLKLPFIQASQAQKHVTHNEAIRSLDALIHLSAISMTNTPPPLHQAREKDTSSPPAPPETG